MLKTVAVARNPRPPPQSRLLPHHTYTTRATKPRKYSLFILIVNIKLILKQLFEVSPTNESETSSKRALNSVVCHLFFVMRCVVFSVVLYVACCLMGCVLNDVLWVPKAD